MIRPFRCFGDKPVELPDNLLPIVHPTEGYKSAANASYVASFIEWVDASRWPANTVLGEPQDMKVLSLSEERCRELCSARHAEGDVMDESN